MKAREIINILKTENDQAKIKEAIEKIKTTRVLLKVIDDLYLNNTIIEQIIKEKVNKKNIKKIIKTLYYKSGVIGPLLEHKNKEIKELVKNISLLGIYRIIKQNKAPFLHNYVLQERSKDAETIIKYAPLRISVFLKCPNYDMAQIMWQKRQKRLLTASKLINITNIMDWLSSKNVPTKVKYNIYEKHKLSFNIAIKLESIVNIEYLYLSNTSYVPNKLREKIVEIRKKTLIKKLKQDNVNTGDLVLTLLYGDKSIELKALIIKELVNEKNLIEVLENLPTGIETDRVLHLKNEEMQKLISKISIKNIKEGKVKGISKSLLNCLYKSYPKEFSQIIDKLSTKEKIEIINNKDLSNSLKTLVLYSLDIEEDIECILSLVEKHPFEQILLNYNKAKERIKECGIDYNAFIQYGSGSAKYNNWLSKINSIQNMEEFKNVKKYLEYYYYQNDKENKVYEIRQFQELMHSYETLRPLLVDLCTNKNYLNQNNKLTLKLLFENNNISNHPKNYEELTNFRKKAYETNKSIIKSIKNVEQNKDIILQILDETITVKKIYNDVESFKLLLKDNSKSMPLKIKIKEMILYTLLLEKIEKSTLQTKYEILKNIYNSYETFITIQNTYIDFDEKIRSLYELEMNTNITSLENYSKDEIIDLTDKNYILCAHIISSKENKDDLVNGVATPKTNFISLSPISYKGQKYYYDNNERNIILLYDYIPKGSFICSALENMGSNGMIKSFTSEVNEKVKNQRGILETSAVTHNNAEILLYREGLKPCGIRIEKGKEPNVFEKEMHEKYHLPFIITQKKNTCIENPKEVFKPKEIKYEVNPTTDILELLNIIKTKNPETNDIYTGREIAIFTDAHAMFEPLLAVLENIRKKGITEIYSLGDNVGLGPNPREVLDLLEEYNVKSVAGNSEFYNTIGLEPFIYFTEEKTKNQLWTREKLEDKIETLKSYPVSYDISLGNKRLGLCHFINDIRWDYLEHSTWTYQSNFQESINAKQFLYTNSKEAYEYMLTHSNDKAIKDAIKNPLFEGKKIEAYDAILQGHVHFDMKDKLNKTNIYTLRALGMGWKTSDRSQASYYILKEKKDGTFDIEKKDVQYNKSNLILSIKSSSIPYKDKILTFLK